MPKDTINTNESWSLTGGSRDHLLDVSSEDGVIAHVCTEDACDASSHETAIGNLICASPLLLQAARHAVADIDGLLERVGVSLEDSDEPAVQTLNELKVAIAVAEGKEAE